MHAIYHFVSGPMVWVAFTVFILGCVYRILHMIMGVYRKERFIFSYMSLTYSLRSILHWIIPFGTESMRKHPALTVVTFAFHVCLFVVPLFLLSHIVLWDEAWGINWFSLPDSTADAMTLVVIGCCVFFLVRRIKTREIRFVTSASDYLLLAVVAAPFVTGFMAYHQWFGYRVFVVLHIISGEIMLMAIPFTRLSHMIFAPFTRAYMGSEFGAVRHAKDW